MLDGLVRRPEGVGSALGGFGSHRGSPGRRWRRMVGIPVLVRHWIAGTAWIIPALVKRSSAVFTSQRVKPHNFSCRWPKLDPGG